MEILYVVWALTTCSQVHGERPGQAVELCTTLRTFRTESECTKAAAAAFVGAVFPVPYCEMRQAYGSTDAKTR